MFPFSYYRTNYTLIANAVEKMEKNELTIEDILDEDDLVYEIKSNPQSLLINL